MKQKMIKTKDGVLPEDLYNIEKQYKSTIKSAPDSISPSALFGFMKKIISLNAKLKTTLKK